jgi:hypothetical protein
MTSRRTARGPKRPLDHSATAPGSTNPRQPYLFSGAHFYFFPNSRTNRARALRIDKAIQNGAAFCPQWTTKVTHVIMDDGMHFEEFTKYHKELRKIPGTVIVVNGRYVADCIAYGMVLVHDQRVYQVPGHAVTEDESSKLKRTASAPLFPAKAAKALESALQRSVTDQAAPKVKRKPYATQEYDSIVDRIKRANLPKKVSPNHETFAPKVSNAAPIYNDDLSVMINEAKAIAHLVRCLVVVCGK